MIGRLGATLKNLVFPPMCQRCAAWPGEGAPDFCGDCDALIGRERQEPFCPRCAATVPPFSVSHGRCGKCRTGRTPLQGTVRVGPYGPALGTLVRAYKYHGCDELEPKLAGWLTDVIRTAPWIDRVQAIVAVPTHWRHRLGRPLYVAEMLAAFVAGRTNLPNLPILRRTRAGPHQIGLSYTRRVENVRGAFAVRDGVTLCNARVLLIDDVMTTGATLEECARMLRGGGAAEVYAAILVRAEGRGSGSPPRQ